MQYVNGKLAAVRHNCVQYSLVVVQPHSHKHNLWCSTWHNLVPEGQVWLAARKKPTRGFGKSGYCILFHFGCLAAEGVRVWGLFGEDHSHTLCMCLCAHLHFFLALWALF